MSEFAMGDHVEWNFEAGTVSGVIRAIHVAMHKENALRKAC